MIIWFAGFFNEIFVVITPIRILIKKNIYFCALCLFYMRTLNESEQIAGAHRSI